MLLLKFNRLFAKSWFRKLTHRMTELTDTSLAMNQPRMAREGDRGRFQHQDCRRPQAAD